MFCNIYIAMYYIALRSCPVKFSRSANASFDWPSTKSYCALYEYPSSLALPYLLFDSKTGTEICVSP